MQFDDLLAITHLKLKTTTTFEVIFFKGEVFYVHFLNNTNKYFYDLDYELFKSHIKTKIYSISLPREIYLN